MNENRAVGSNLQHSPGQTQGSVSTKIHHGGHVPIVPDTQPKNCGSVDKHPYDPRAGKAHP